MLSCYVFMLMFIVSSLVLMFFVELFLGTFWPKSYHGPLCWFLLGSCCGSWWLLCFLFIYLIIYQFIYTSFYPTIAPRFVFFHFITIQSGTLRLWMEWGSKQSSKHDIWPLLQPKIDASVVDGLNACSTTSAFWKSQFAIIPFRSL